MGRREAPLQRAVAGAEGTQGPVAQGGGEGHQPGVRHASVRQLVAVRGQPVIGTLAGFKLSLNSPHALDLCSRVRASYDYVAVLP